LFPNNLFKSQGVYPHMHVNMKLFGIASFAEDGRAGVQKCRCALALNSTQSPHLSKLHFFFFRIVTATLFVSSNLRIVTATLFVSPNLKIVTATLFVSPNFRIVTATLFV
jgi:hypothetical protein